MKPKHTPGPWHLFNLNVMANLSREEVRRLFDNNSEHLDHNSIVADVTERKKPLKIAGCDWRGDAKTEALANARLIAAAPELLEALERLLSCTRDDDDSLAAAQDQAMDAIAKARGES